jgi:hypothetical protein
MTTGDMVASAALFVLMLIVFVGGAFGGKGK